MTTIAIALAAALGTARAAAPEDGPSTLSIEQGAFHVPGSQWELVDGGGSTLDAWGIRYARRVRGPLSAVVEWQHGAEGGRLGFPDTDAELALAFVSDRVAVGASAGIAVAPWLSPYATAQVFAWRGRLLMDDAPDEPGNPNEVALSGLTAGAALAAGVEVRAFRVGPARLVAFGELGYGRSLPLRVRSDTGTDAGQHALVSEFALGGAVGGIGIGARF